MLDNNSLLATSLNFNLLKKMVEEKEKININDEIDILYSQYLKNKNEALKKYHDKLISNNCLNLNNQHKFLQYFIKEYFKKSDYSLVNVYFKNYDNNNAHYADISINGTFTTKENYLKQLKYCLEQKVSFEDIAIAEVPFDFQLRELFGNCSTVVFNRLQIEQFEYSRLGLKQEHNPYIYNLVCSLATELAKMAGYTRILYSFSDKETNGREVFEDCLKNNGYIPLEQYNNKRGSSKITIYSKDLTK